MASACRVPGGRPSFALRAFNGWGVVMTPVTGGSPIRMTVRAGHGGVPLAHGFDLPAKLRSPGILLHPLLEQGDLIDAPRGGVKDDAVADPDDIAEGVSPRGQQIAVSWSIALPRDIKRLGGQAAGGSFPGLGGFWMFVAEGELPGEAFRRAVTVLAAHLPLRGIGCGQITVPVHFDGGVAVLAQQPARAVVGEPRHSGRERPRARWPQGRGGRSGSGNRSPMGYLARPARASRANPPWCFRFPGCDARGAYPAASSKWSDRFLDRRHPGGRGYDRRSSQYPGHPASARRGSRHRPSQLGRLLVPGRWLVWRVDARGSTPGARLQWISSGSCRQACQQWAQARHRPQWDSGRTDGAHRRATVFVSKRARTGCVRCVPLPCSSLTCATRSAYPSWHCPQVRSATGVAPGLA